MVLTMITKLTLQPSAENINKVKAALLDVSKVYSAEQSTLSWKPSQDPFNNRVFYVVEQYQDVKGLRMHQQHPAYQPSMDALQGFLAQPLEVSLANEL